MASIATCVTRAGGEPVREPVQIAREGGEGANGCGGAIRRNGDELRRRRGRLPESGKLNVPTAEQLQRLHVRSGSDVKCRRVELRCGSHIFSGADNWYVPSRLTAEMNRLLETRRHRLVRQFNRCGRIGGTSPSRSCGHHYRRAGNNNDWREGNRASGSCRWCFRRTSSNTAQSCTRAITNRFLKLSNGIKGNSWLSHEAAHWQQVAGGCLTAAAPDGAVSLFAQVESSPRGGRG